VLGNPSVSAEKVALLALGIRANVISMVTKAGSGHPAGSLGMADVFSALYFGGVLQYDPKKPWSEDRDRLLLSNGHICPVWYATLAEAGFFPKEELLTLRQKGSRLQGHPLARKLPGVENTSGSLGQGLSQACGFALSAQLKQKKWRTYCILGDGEQQEGQVWEAYWFAGNRKLHTLTAIIDRNNIQSDGFTEDTAPLEPFRAKLEAFNWHVLEVDGHNVQEIIAACHHAKTVFEKPTAIIAHTIPGKGVEFMEGTAEWHAKSPSPEEAREALRALQTLRGRVAHE